MYSLFLCHYMMGRVCGWGGVLSGKDKISLTSDSRHYTALKHLRCIHPSLLNIELDSIVVDELHLMLRVGDLLLRKLIFYADSRDHGSRENQGEEANNLQQLEQAIRSCGVSFQIWQKRERTGKPISRSYYWTALTSRHKLQVLKMLPEKMTTLMPDSIFPRVAALWKVSMQHMHNNYIILKILLQPPSFRALYHHDKLEPFSHWDWQIPWTGNCWYNCRVYIAC